MHAGRGWISLNEDGWEIMRKIKVSVIVPVYNAALYLRECMDSLVCQTLQEIEIICVNDGSTDGSADLLETYAERDRRVRVIHKDNTGYGHTMNVGMDAAQGEYIGIAEPDDYVRQDMYERLYRIAKKLDLDMIKADFSQFWGNGKDRKKEYQALSKNKADYGKVMCPARQPGVFCFLMNTWTGIYKREFLNRHQIRHHETPGASFQDLGFWFQTFCLARRVYFHKESLYRYRRDNAASSVNSPQKADAVYQEYAFMRDFLERRPELKQRYLPVYVWKKYHDCQFTAARTAAECRGEFFTAFARDFYTLQKAGELSPRYFTKGDWRRLQKIMKAPEKYAACFGRHNIWYQAGYYRQQYGRIRTIKKMLCKTLQLQNIL